MTFWESVLYGILQGATEFLPVSSSGHLLLLSVLLGSEGYSLFYAVVLHFGTLLALLIALRRDIFTIFKRENRGLLLYLFLATLPTVAIAVIVKLFVGESFLNSLLPIGFALTIVCLMLTHFFSKQNKLLTPLPAVIAGLAQGLALVPGLSRSGATITALSLCGIKRTQAVKFSFLLSIPVIVGSLLVEGYGAIKSSQPLLPFGIIATGCLCAFVVGFLCIKLLFKAAKSNNFLPFALYLAIPLTLSLILL